MRYETIHAVTYFAPESAEAAKQAGLRGFWMGYFGFRAAPMGAVSLGVVHATFANFAESRVRRAIPDAWSLASPDALVASRRTSAAAALGNLDDRIAETAEQAVPLLEKLVSACEGLGRPLFAANAALDLPEEPVERLWQLCTTLREHRGDGHVIALAANRITGAEAHLLLGAEFGLPDEMFVLARGFEQAEWEYAREQLGGRGLLSGESLTAEGRELRVEVERLTDDLADPPLDSLTPSELGFLSETLERSARAIQASGLIPEQNPMGLPTLH
jgi:hypothetical protein